MKGGGQVDFVAVRVTSGDGRVVAPAWRIHGVTLYAGRRYSTAMFSLEDGRREAGGPGFSLFSVPSTVSGFPLSRKRKRRVE